jgi:hypothetical protein
MKHIGAPGHRTSKVNVIEAPDKPKQPLPKPKKTAKKKKTTK